MRRTLKKLLALVCMASITCLSVSGCGAAKEKRTIRIGHNQSTNHPTHIALTAFQDFINEKLGDKYVVELTHIHVGKAVDEDPAPQKEVKSFRYHIVQKDGKYIVEQG